jgi:hypothetical protein
MRKPITSVWALCWVLVVSGTVVAAGSRNPRSKRQSPSAALQTATKNFVKAKSYRVRLAVEGGYSEKADHSISQRVVSESYTGEVYSGMMHIPEVKAYRTLKRGTAYIDGYWRDILSDRTTTKAARLFRFPEVVLGNALRHSRRSGTWLEPKGAAAAEKEAAGGNAEAKESADDGPSGRTAVGTSRSPDKEARGSEEEELPRVVRVEAPPAEALQHILEVQNSNCFGVG